MSEAMIKRWNEITMDRSEGPAAASSSKRSRPRAHSQSSSNESEDNISIVSRSPSPAPRNDKEEDISVYDQYIRGPILEPVTVNTKISSSNKGFGMLAKMGWKEGEGLGASGQGRTDPVPFLVKLDALGLGRSTYDERIIESAVSQRRELDSERMIKETEEQRRIREASGTPYTSVAAKEQIKTEVNDILRSFYCTDCEKQYKNVAQFDEHVRSYAHTHVVRMKEQQATARQRQSGESAARKAKEKKREEKEMKKMAAAAGIKYSSGSATSSSIVVPAQPTIKPVAINSGGGFAPVSDPPARRGGWSAVTAPTESTGARSFAPVSATTVTPVGLKKTGWTAVANPAISSSIPTAGAESQDPKQSTKKMGGGFMRGGWTTLDTGTSADQDIEMASPVTVSSKRVIPPPPTDPAPLPPPPPPTLDPPPPPPEDVPPPPPPSHPAPNGWWPSR
ncbi:Zinc-finger double-stranded RNA-binding, partial [Rhizoctonia solani]